MINRRYSNEEQSRNLEKKKTLLGSFRTQDTWVFKLGNFAARVVLVRLASPLRRKKEKPRISLSCILRGGGDIVERYNRTLEKDRRPQKSMVGGEERDVERYIRRCKPCIRAIAATTMVQIAPPLLLLLAPKRNKQNYRVSERGAFRLVSLRRKEARLWNLWCNHPFPPLVSL